MMMRVTTQSGRRAWRQRSFTMVELLVVMGIMAILGVLTVISYRAISRDAKLSSARNAVAAVLDNARGLAMKNNRIVMVVFRSHLDGAHDQVVEAVSAQFADTGVACVGCASTAGCTCAAVVDRFVPIPGVPNRTLPHGIKVALPGYGADFDAEWHVVSHLPAIDPITGMGERAGEQIAVMFAPDGTTISQNAQTDSRRMYVDYNNNGGQDLSTGAVAPPPTIFYSTWPAVATTDFNGSFPNHHGFFEHVYNDDEPYVEVAPFLTVFDDDQARALNDPNRWNGQIAGAAAFVNRRNDYAVYINNNLDPIYFNRYTGVAMSAHK